MPENPGQTSRPSLFRSAARVVAVLAACFASADACRWGNRLYVSGMFGRSGDGYMSSELSVKAAEALSSGAFFLAAAVVAAIVGWQLLPRRSARID